LVGNKDVTRGRKQVFLGLIFLWGVYFSIKFDEFVFFMFFIKFSWCSILTQGLPWSYSEWIYNYLCNQCPSPLTLWVWIPLRRGIQYYVIKFVSDLWFSPVYTTNKNDRHDIIEILLKVVLSTITLALLLVLYCIFKEMF
jgi:hypothetical protein